MEQIIGSYQYRQYESYFNKSVSSAEKYFSVQIRKNLSMFNALSEPCHSIQIFCPGAGLLPGLATLLNELQGNRYSNIHDINVVCVEHGNYANLFNAFFTSVHHKVNFHTYQFNIYHGFDAPERKQVVRKTANASSYNLTIDYYMTDIQLFLENYSGPAFQVVFYENPSVASIGILPEIAGWNNGTTATRISFPLLSRALSKDTVIIVQTRTRLELWDCFDLIHKSLIADKPQINSLTLNNCASFFYPIDSYYRHGFFTKPLKGLCNTNAIDRALIAEEITSSDRLVYPIATAFSFFANAISKPFNSYNLATLNANRTEWFSLFVFLLSLIHIGGHRVGLTGDLKHYVLLTCQVMLLFMMNQPDLDPDEYRKGF